MKLNEVTEKDIRDYFEYYFDDYKYKESGEFEMTIGCEDGDVVFGGYYSADYKFYPGDFGGSNDPTSDVGYHCEGEVYDTDIYDEDGNVVKTIKGFDFDFEN